MLAMWPCDTTASTAAVLVIPSLVFLLMQRSGSRRFLWVAYHTLGRDISTLARFIKLAIVLQIMRMKRVTFPSLLDEKCRIHPNKV